MLVSLLITLLIVGLIIGAIFYVADLVIPPPFNNWAKAAAIVIGLIIILQRSGIASL